MENIFSQVERQLSDKGYLFEKKDFERPWGGFWVIEQSQSSKFISEYFLGVDLDVELEISPKILLVAPQKRLSWQYHHRRAELWRVVEGEVGVVKSNTDEETPIEILGANAQVRLGKGERHRLIGLEDYGIVAEIWIHTDKALPSNEDDIVRLQDDFERKTPST